MANHLRHLGREFDEQFAKLLVAEKLVRLQQALILPRRRVGGETVSVEKTARVGFLVGDDELDEFPRRIRLLAALVDHQPLPRECGGAAAELAVRQLPRRQRHGAPLALQVGRELLEHVEPVPIGTDHREHFTELHCAVEKERVKNRGTLRHHADAGLHLLAHPAQHLDRRLAVGINRAVLAKQITSALSQ